MNCINLYQQEESFDSSPTTEFEESEHNIPLSINPLNICVPYMLLSDDTIQQQETKYEIQELYISSLPLNIYQTSEDNQPCNSQTNAKLEEHQHPSIFSRQQLSSGSLPPSIKDSDKQQHSKESLPPKKSETKKDYGYDNFNRILGEIFPPHSTDGNDGKKSVHSCTNDEFHEKIRPEVLSVEKMKKSSSYDVKSQKKSSSIKGVQQGQENYYQEQYQKHHKPQNQEHHHQPQFKECHQQHHQEQQYEQPAYQKHDTIVVVKPSRSERKSSSNMSGAKTFKVESDKNVKDHLKAKPVKSISFNEGKKGKLFKDKSTGDDKSLSVAPLDPSSLMNLLQGGKVAHKKSVEMKDPNLTISKYEHLKSPKIQNAESSPKTSNRYVMTQSCSNYMVQDFKDSNPSVQRHSDSARCCHLKKQSVHSQTSHKDNDCQTVHPHERGVGTGSSKEFRKSCNNSDHYQRKNVETQKSRSNDAHVLSFENEVEMENYKFTSPKRNSLESLHRADKATNRPSKNFQIHKEVVQIRSMSTQASSEKMVTGTEYTVEPLKKSYCCSSSTSSKKNQSNQTGYGKQERSTMPEDVKPGARTLGVNTIYKNEDLKRKRKKPCVLKNKDKNCCCMQTIRDVKGRCKDCRCESMRHKNKPVMVKSSHSNKTIKSSESRNTIKGVDSRKSLKSCRNRNRANQTGERGIKNAYINSDPIVTAEDGVQICGIKVNVVDRSRFEKQEKRGSNIFQSLFRIYHSKQVPRIKLSSIWPFQKNKKKSRTKK